MDGDPGFVRWQAAEPNARGTFPGVFALANGLARDGRLEPGDRAWWRQANDRMQAAYQDPGALDPGLFDRRVNPVVSCWFRSSATHLIAEVGGYLELLDRYGTRWVERRSAAPGRVLYEDEVQVVVVPHNID